MKFSWRANWEILLVLVIIVVGIVITTIAAIRNKDKNPLVLAEEADFGQLLAGANGGFGDATNSVVGGKDSSSGSASDGSLLASLTGNDETQLTGGEQQVTRRPLLHHHQAMLKTSRPSSSFAHNNHVVRGGDQASSTPTGTGSGGGRLSSSAAAAVANGGYAHHHHHHHHLQGSSTNKYEDSNLSEYNRLAHQSDLHSPVGGTTIADQNMETGIYDTAMSTEPTPNQFNPLINGEGGRGLHNRIRGNQHQLQFNNRSQQHLHNNNQIVGEPVNTQAAAYGDQMSESVDLIDDIHTTRSSLAGSSNGGGGAGAAAGGDSQQHFTGNPSGGAGVLGSQLEQQLPITPSLALYAPYGVTPTSLQQLISQANHFNNNNNNNHKLLDPQQQLQQPSSGLMGDTEDMMTSYSKLGASNLTEAIIRDYALNHTLSNLTAAANQQQQTQLMLANLMNGATGGDSQLDHQFGGGIHHQTGQKLSPSLGGAAAASHHRALSASLPISMLLGDLLKLTRPQQQSAGSTLESGARPHNSILQQLRSLPGPLVALLQNLSPSGNQANDLASLTNHDASESNQHYHRISMSPTDVHSILARSIQSSSALPAFPAPKGVPQNWIPPTAGGSPNYHSAQNSNADFVAGNAAGFVRASIQGGGSSSSSTSGSSEKSTYQHPQQQAQPLQQVDAYQRSGNNDYGVQQPVDMSNNNIQQQAGVQQQVGGANQHNFQHQNNIYSNLIIGNSQQQQQQVDQVDKQLQQQQPVFPANHAPENVVQLDRSWPSTQQSSGFVQQPPSGNGRSQMGRDDLQSARLKTANILPQGGAVGGKNGIPDYAAYLNFQQSVLDQVANQQQQQFNSIQNHQLKQQMPFNHAPTYNSARLQQNDLSVAPMSHYPQQQQQQQQQRAAAFDFNAGGAVESAPKISIANSQQNQQVATSSTGNGGNLPLNNNNNNNRQISNNIQQQNKYNQQSSISGQSGKTRKRRSSGLIQAEEGRVDEVMSGRYGINNGDDDDDSDSQPISVVRPDGQPTNSGRVRGFPAAIDDEMSSSSGQANDQRPPKSSSSSSRGRVALTSSSTSDRQVAQSQRTANHLKQESTHHYPSEHYMSLYSNGNINNNNKKQIGQKQLSHHQRSKFDNSQHNSNELDKSSLINGGNKQAKRVPYGTNSRNKNKKMSNIEMASSGLMSKLLGTASTTDETEEDADDDDDASEKRKEEIEDAEFGIVNDDRQALRPLGDVNNNEHPPTSDILNSVDGGGGGGVRNDDSSSMGSGSNDNEAYTRRNQQRSDIEFYGHPGEETRTLKYGILGSGNYEVVNGGIYPEADESTAAVNSVANYVRKPGGALMNGLPKLLADHSHQSGPQSSYIPGARLGGYMRGASANPDDLVGLVPTAGGLAKDPMVGNPMLELIDANGAQIFDPNMMAHLGSSSQTTHTTRDNYNEDDSSSSSHDDNSYNQQSGASKQQRFGLPTISKGEFLSEDGSTQKKKNNNNSKSTRTRNKPSNNKFKSSTDNDLMDSDHSDGHDDDSDDGANRSNSNNKSNQQLQEQQSSISGSRSHGTNQFNSYQISPSKKVTIFSDQDLDSAPSELEETLVGQSDY